MPRRPSAAIATVAASSTPTRNTAASATGAIALGAGAPCPSEPVAGNDGLVRVLSAAVDGRPAPSPAPVDVVRAGPGEAPPAGRPLPQLRIQP